MWLPEIIIQIIIQIVIADVIVIIGHIIIHIAQEEIFQEDRIKIKKIKSDKN